MQRMQADRFDTVLPKTERFFSPSKPSKRQFPVWGYLIIGGLIGAILPVVTNKGVERPFSPLDYGAKAYPTPTPAAPLPEVRQPRLMPPTPSPVSETPRAQLVHLRPIGTSENDRMPDGRVLTTLYKGELPNAAHLPRSGAQLGDMWYTRNDGHSWVLAPVVAGSQTTGWVDP